MATTTCPASPWLPQYWHVWLTSALIVYLFAVRQLRHRRSRLLDQQFPDRASFAKMTCDDAVSVQRFLMETEFPAIISTSAFFALFKTYGIPSISTLLLQTGQLANPATTSKRATDTGVLILESIFFPRSSTRTINGLARINYLHNSFRRAGKILDDDMLYTLSLFALEQVRWTRRYEWRPLSNVEVCALGTLWKDTGDCMEIPYTKLRSDHWADGLQWMNELEEWSLKYEAENMLPAESNKELGAGATEHLLFTTPSFAKPVMRKFVAALMEDRLRIAMKIDKPSSIYYTILDTFFHLRKLYLRHLALPRPHRSRRVWLQETPDPSTGRCNMPKYRARPWYVKPSLKWRWGFKAWRLWWQGVPLPGDEGGKYFPEGYLVEEVGPESKRGRGAEEMEGEKRRLEGWREKVVLGRGGCPFAGGI